MHRGLSSVMITTRVLLVMKRKQKLSLRETNRVKLTGSRDDMHEKLVYKCGLKRREVWDTNSMSWYTKVYYVDGSFIILFCFIKGN